MSEAQSVDKSVVQSCEAVLGCLKPPRARFPQQASQAQVFFLKALHRPIRWAGQRRAEPAFAEAFGKAKDAA